MWDGIVMCVATHPTLMTAVLNVVPYVNLWIYLWPVRPSPTAIPAGDLGSGGSRTTLLMLAKLRQILLLLILDQRVLEQSY
jgi:hypothetical protein